MIKKGTEQLKFQFKKVHLIIVWVAQEADPQLPSLISRLHCKAQSTQTCSCLSRQAQEGTKKSLTHHNHVYRPRKCKIQEQEAAGDHTPALPMFLHNPCPDECVMDLT